MSTHPNAAEGLSPGDGLSHAERASRMIETILSGDTRNATAQDVAFVNAVVADAVASNQITAHDAFTAAVEALLGPSGPADTLTDMADGPAVGTADGPARAHDDAGDDDSDGIQL